MNSDMYTENFSSHIVSAQPGIPQGIPAYPTLSSWGAAISMSAYKSDDPEGLSRSGTESTSTQSAKISTTTNVSSATSITPIVAPTDATIAGLVLSKVSTATLVGGIMGGVALFVIMLASVTLWTWRRQRRRHREARRQQLAHPFTDWQPPIIHPKAGIQPLHQREVDPHVRRAGGTWQEASPTIFTPGTITISWGPGVSPSSPRNAPPPSYTPLQVL